MNPEVKKLWVEALRSPKYKQVQGMLKDGRKFCCLGVLCDISKLGKWGKRDNGGFTPYRIDAEFDSDTELPERVWEWAGLPDSLGSTVSINGKRLDLASHNDAGRTFAEIADAIEAQL